MLLLPLAGGASGYLYSYIQNVNQEIVYEAEAVLLVQERRAGLAPGVSDVGVSRQLAATYRVRVTSAPFLERVVQDPDVDLSVGQLRAMLAAFTGSDPVTLVINVKHGDPNLASATADKVADTLTNYVIELRLAEIARLQAAAAAQGLSNVQSLVSAQFGLMDSLTVLEPANVATRLVRSRTWQTTLLGFMLGVMVATGGVLLLGSLTDTVRNVEDLPRRFGFPALGAIFRWSSEEVGDDDLVVWKSPSSGYSESFKQVRANLQFATVNQPGNAYLVTSPGPEEGKSTIICNLAITLAQLGKRVMVVDGDLRRPSVHRLLRTGGREPGLSNFLAEQAMEVRDVVHATEVEGVTVIPAGPIPPNPSELLATPRMSALLEQSREMVDVVLVDSPPVLVVADGPIIASQVDGAIVVVDGFSTRSSSLRAALDALSKTQVNIVGGIINKLKRARFTYGYNYPYYYYKYYRTSDSDGAQVDGAGRSFPRLRSALSRFKGTRNRI
jgi:non-specific protein-tyrosine kinase